eukprot:CAMPEP_0170571058 /NCGR_PEP_ID=MMETSP0224-20130122/1456_1 /TAXON_ID=285029 /ORGANISM="Togula jolla, Strain CCCM 725" /LENGTH=169 /DNA_ID=CAMNT_0010893407 /DNA_START=62 /DNA_END=572 /DNA_ORIENTATION=-
MWGPLLSDPDHSTTRKSSIGAECSELHDVPLTDAHHTENVLGHADALPTFCLRGGRGPGAGPTGFIVAVYLDHGVPNGELHVWGCRSHVYDDGCWTKVPSPDPLQGGPSGVSCRDGDRAVRLHPKAEPELAIATTWPCSAQCEGAAEEPAQKMEPPFSWPSTVKVLGLK